MLGGITFEVCGAIPGSFFGLKRNGRVIDHGHIRDLGDKYRTGDVVLISHEMWDALKERSVLSPPHSKNKEGGSDG
jgi:hypothetical protein